VVLKNVANYSLPVTYFEAIPWYLRLFYHTMNATINGEQKKLNERKEGEAKWKKVSHRCKTFSTVFDRYRLIPAEEHSTPGVIEFQTLLQPQSTLRFTIQFEKVCFICSLRFHYFLSLLVAGVSSLD
jgi:hypothetical protein